MRGSAGAPAATASLSDPAPAQQTTYPARIVDPSGSRTSIPAPSASRALTSRPVSIVPPAAHVRGKRRGDGPEVDHPGGRRVKGGDPARVRLDLGDLLGPDAAQPGDAVGRAAALELFEGAQFRVVRGDDQLAGAPRLDAPLGAVAVEQLGAFHAELRLQRARRVVDARVDDPARAPGLLGREAGFALEHRQRAARLAGEQLARDREPDDATPRRRPPPRVPLLDMARRVLWIWRELSDEAAGEAPARPLAQGAARGGGVGL